ncbi:MAG: precorrin-3B C(17)-methyltransferase [Firmicutes bacterium]|nr:precorrin-3B C(17)-methyltransferase [Bacillota bacterium]
MNKLYVVGTGPGRYDEMTVRAVQILGRCEVIVGYHVYVELIKEHFPNAEFLTSSMKKEKERCIMALGEASKGRMTALISGGDACVYGMAGIAIELSANFENVEVEVVSGVTAALGGAAVLGAPVGHDFAVISLSDLLTPFDVILKRIEAAAKADFVICIYNPASEKRKGHLKTACGVILKHRKKTTVCAAVKNIGREGCRKTVMTLEELAEYEADMSTTVFVGSSQTNMIGKHMVTPRGYSI